MTTKPQSYKTSNSNKTPRRLHDIIVATIGKKIISGEYAEDLVLENETKLSANLNASRTATREALKILSSKGLIESRPKAGTIVKTKMHWDLLDPLILKWCLEDEKQSFSVMNDLYEVRLTFEPTCAMLAAYNHTEDDIKSMRQALRGMGVYADNNDKIQSDLAFHLSILKATQNSLFMSFGATIAVGLKHIFRTGLEATADEDDQWIDKHKSVFDAIQKKDGKGAKKQMQSLLQDAKQVQINYHIPPLVIKKN